VQGTQYLLIVSIFILARWGNFLVSTTQRQQVKSTILTRWINPKWPPPPSGVHISTCSTYMPTVYSILQIHQEVQTEIWVGVPLLSHIVGVHLCHDVFSFCFMIVVNRQIYCVWSLLESCPPLVIEFDWVVCALICLTMYEYVTIFCIMSECLMLWLLFLWCYCCCMLLFVVLFSKFVIYLPVCIYSLCSGEILCTRFANCTQLDIPHRKAACWQFGSLPMWVHEFLLFCGFNAAVSNCGILINVKRSLIYTVLSY